MPGLLTQTFPLHNPYSIDGVKLAVHTRDLLRQPRVHRFPSLFGLGGSFAYSALQSTPWPTHVKRFVEWINEVFSATSGPRWLRFLLRLKGLHPAGWRYYSGVRILFLGNSNEVLDLPPGALRRHEIIQAELARDFGEAEVVTRPAWPTEKFPEVLARWIVEFAPDVVYLNVAEYWCLYESVPLRVERTFGRLGKPAAKAGLGAAATPWLAHNRVFRKFRETAQVLVQGATPFTPEEVVTRVMASVRVVLRNEGMVVVVDGQRGRRPHSTNARGRDRVEARRQFVHRALGAACARLHVLYGGDDVPQWETHPEGMDGHADGLHQGVGGQAWMAHESLELIRAALRQAGVSAP